MHRGERSGARLSAQSVALIVKHRARAVGMEPARLAGHSLRAGYTTTKTVYAGAADAIEHVGGSPRLLIPQTGRADTDGDEPQTPRGKDSSMRYVAIGTRVTLGFDGAPVGTVIGDAIHDGADYSVVHWDDGEVAEHPSAALVAVERQLTPARLDAMKSHVGLPRDSFDRRANGTETGREEAIDGSRAEAPDDAKRL